jgi:excisionase family DNA binding protein
MTTETYFTPREAAEYLRTSPSTLAKLRLSKRGPAFTRIGRAIRYRRTDCDSWMSSSLAHYVQPSRRGPVTSTSEDQGQ